MTTSSKTNNKMTKENTKLKEELQKLMCSYEMPHGSDFDELWNWIDHALTQAREEGIEKGKKAYIKIAEKNFGKIKADTACILCAGGGGQTGIK